MLNMVPFNFLEYLTRENKFDIKSQSFFKKREDLFGNTLSEIFVKDPKLINEALTVDTSQNVFDNSLAERMYANETQEELNNLKNVGHFKGTSVFFLQCNFI